MWFISFTLLLTCVANCIVSYNFQTALNAVVIDYDKGNGVFYNLQNLIALNEVGTYVWENNILITAFPRDYFIGRI